MTIKIGLGFGLVMLLLVANAIAFFVIQTSEGRSRELSRQSYEVIEALRVLEVQTLNQETGLRGYQLTADKVFLEPYFNGVNGYRKGLLRLRELLSDSPLQLTRLDRLDVAMSTWYEQVAEPIRVQVEASGVGDKASPLTSKGREDFDALRAIIGETQQTERLVLVQRNARLSEQEDFARILTVFLLLLALLLTTYGVRRVQSLIARPIELLTGMMTRLAAHDHAISVPYRQRGDEIGNIARALEVFRGMAIETHGQNRIKTVTAEISASLQELRETGEFANTLTEALACELGCGLAAFHGYDPASEQLECLGGYGLPGGALKQGSAIGLDDGLVGQCARSRRPLTVNELPPDYLRIGSGLGSSLPRCLLLLPLRLQDQLLGVLELASFGSFTAEQQQLLDELLPIVALSFDNLRRAQRTRELLEETQAQSEELQASEESLRVQQEELRAVNEALEQKTRTLESQSAQLRASEEELKLQAEELKVSNETLAGNSATLHEQKLILEDLQRDTQEKADALGRASQYKSEFLANMSHELRTPLNSLLILSRSLSDNDQGHLAADEVEAARVIHESGSKLLQLINDILDLSKVEAGKLEVMIDELPLASFAQTLERSFRHVAKQRGLSFNLVIEDGLPVAIRTDATRVEQIANNLLGNAFKFTRAGQVEVRIGRPATGQRLPPGLDPALALAIAVSDTGIGIPEDKFHKMFQSFQQVDAGTSRQFGGTGLGLSIARGMARRLGGDVAMQSQYGVGSCFTLLLPFDPPPDLLAEIQREPLPALSPPETSAVAQPNTDEASGTLPVLADDRKLIVEQDTVILIIEDDPVFARILAELIRRRGYRVLAAGDGESGLRLAREFRPAGVLLDVMLPGMDGWAVLDRMKADTLLQTIPVHFISATDDAARGVEAGAIGFLTKPVSKASLLQAFDRLLHPGQELSRRVLLIDDDSATRQAVRALLSDSGVELVDVASGEEGLMQVANSRFDCIVLDLGLPGISGQEFLEAASRKGPLPPVVIHSGRELSRDESLSLRQYTDSIVIKGARSPERLLDEVSLFLHSLKPAAAPPLREIDAGLSGRTVLVVDDDMRNIFALSKTLRARGLKVLMAQDGRKALKQLDDNADIELVLMDIMMPVLDGYDTMREIRAQPKHVDLPIIALTAKAMRGDREKCLEAGASDYLSKPIDIDKLLSMMRVLMP